MVPVAVSNVDVRECQLTTSSSSNYIDVHLLNPLHVLYQELTDLQADGVGIGAVLTSLQTTGLLDAKSSEYIPTAMQDSGIMTDGVFSVYNPLHEVTRDEQALMSI